MGTLAPAGVRHMFRRAAQAYQPLSVMIEITHRCHLACAHCYLEDNHDWSSRRDELSTDELCALIDALHAEGCLFLAITGGEVFLRKDLLTLLRHARGRGLAVTLFTTGTLLSDETLAELVRLRLWRVELSLYSADPAVHDGITRRPGSHAKTMWALRRLHAAGVSVLIKCPLMRQNFDSYEGLRALAHEMGIRFNADVTVLPMNNDDTEPTRYRLTQQQLATFFSRPEIKPFSGVERRLPDPSAPLCSIGTRSCVIGPFGDVYTCMGYHHPVGNVREQPFGTIWHEAPVLQRVRQLTARDLDVCSQCEKFAYCNRCAGAALSEDGDFLGPLAWACHVAAAKERAAGLPVTPSAAERLGLVEVYEHNGELHLRSRRGRQAQSARACGPCSNGCG